MTLHRSQRILLLLMFLPFPGRVSGGDTLDCPSLTIAARAGVAVQHGKGLLWQIAKPGIAASHLFGTIHLGDEDLMHIPAPVAQALDRSREFVMEANFDGDDVLQWTETMVSSAGPSLRAQLGSVLFERAAALLSRYGISGEVVDRMKPWAVYLALSSPPQITGLPLDLALAARMQQSGKPVSGLETATEQVGIVAQLPLGDQVALVKDAVCYYDTLQADIREMKRLYLDRDLAGLVAAAHRYELMETERYRRLMKNLLSERNDRLVRRMEVPLRRGNVFIAVGALHLPGEGGLLSLLEKRGYTVKAIY